MSAHYLQKLNLSNFPSRISFTRKARSLSLAGLSALLLAGTLWVEPAFTANLKIKFVDPEGKILERVETRITHLVTKRFEHESSNRQGEIEVAGLTDGRYELVAQLKSFFPIKEEIDLTGEVVLERVMFNQKFVDKANKEVAQAVEKREYTKGAERLQQLLKLFPENASLHYNMAIVQEGLKDEEKASAAIDMAIRLAPDRKYQEKKKEMQRDLLLELGQKALNDRDFPKATLHYQKLTEVDPQNAPAFYGLALSLGHQRKYQESLAAINQAIKLAPSEQQYLKVKEMLEINAKSR
ncbi:MAG: tetratricopeptide repeat protein [Acidobacteria bacterium]|nr:tetratricopeptide repeat protein [Acidobacteriota bacterium]MCI0724168.1 tetratricopeptide repeat protein [Acidobacteriota bacterium]